MALTIRAELFKPGLQIVDPEFFNSMTTLHGLIMVFGALMPGAVGLRELDRSRCRSARRTWRSRG